MGVRSTSPLRRSRTASTRPGDLKGVLDIGEPVLGAQGLRPSFDVGCGEFDGAPAAPTDEMVMMVPGTACAVAHLAVLGPDLVDLPIGGKVLQVAIDRR